jgi:fucose 4-O-acetylase-like acetyltransferase
VKVLGWVLGSRVLQPLVVLVILLALGLVVLWVQVQEQVSRLGKAPLWVLGLVLVLVLGLVLVAGLALAGVLG